MSKEETEKGGSALAERNRGIDALRGVSILLVVMHHVGIRIPLAKTALGDLLPKWLLDGINWNGAEGVVVFFVISGFLITRRTQLRWGELRDLSVRGFYWFRATRILPVLLLVVALLSACHLLGVPNYVIDKPSQSLGGAIWAALGFHINWYEGQTGYLPGGWNVMWSLAVEEVFYIGFPLVCITLGRTRFFIPVLIVLALSHPFTRAALAQLHNEIWYEEAYLPGMASIATGVLAACVVRRFTNVDRRAALAVALAGIVGLCTVLFAGRFVWTLLHQGYGLWLNLSAALIVLGAHWLESSGLRLRGVGWLCSCGRLSYEMYLFHMFCVFGVVGIARASGLDMRYGFVWYVPAVALSWLAGYVVALVYSQPVEQRLRRKSTQPAPADTGPLAQTL